MAAEATDNAKYLETYGITELINRLTKELLEAKPADPIKFLIAGLTAAAEEKTGSVDYPPYGLSENIKKLEEWIQVGCGDKPYFCEEKKATFPGKTTPAALPDITEHNNCMTDFFKKNPGVYDKLKCRVTPGGVTLAQIIKTGMDNPGHPMIKTVGLTAGDEDSYTTFAELFDPVISDRHNGYGVDGKQPTDLDIDKISDMDIDPFDKYVLTTRVRTGRSVRGFKLPPTIEFEERRKLEAVCVKGLMNMAGDLKGDYYPLHGSRSYPPKPNGMSEEDEEKLRSQGNLFQEPDSTLLLASGMGRHWPDGRGIFCNDNRNLFVWVGEEDHLRIVSMQGSRKEPTKEGKQIKEVFARFIRACNDVQKVLKEEGYDFMHSDHLGWILTCPSNLGTGLRAGTMVQLPLVSARDDFKKLMGTMGLQARGTGGVDSASTGGTWDISNADRIGKGEVQLCNILIEGAAKLVKWENALETGEGKEDAEKGLAEMAA
jgi:creatine kinase